MIGKVLQARNLTAACRKVVANKGAAGVDGMQVTELKSLIDRHRDQILTDILQGNYVAQPIRGVAIPKSNGKTRLLGVLTVTDRWLQQAVSRQLTTRFELDFEEESYGFRPKRNLHQAVLQSQKHINDGYQDIVDIDLKSFNEVQHHKVFQLIYKKVKCRITLRLIRKWLRAPILSKVKLHKRRKGVPQGRPLSPLLSNIMLDQLDKELKSKGLGFVCYVDDFSIYTKSKAEARKVDNACYLFLKSKLALPINREKSGIRRPVNFEILGHGFVPCCQKGQRRKCLE